MECWISSLKKNKMLYVFDLRRRICGWRELGETMSEALGIRSLIHSNVCIAM